MAAKKPAKGKAPKVEFSNASDAVPKKRAPKVPGGSKKVAPPTWMSSEDAEALDKKFGSGAGVEPEKQVQLPGPEWELFTPKSVQESEPRAEVPKTLDYTPGELGRKYAMINMRSTEKINKPAARRNWEAKRNTEMYGPAGYSESQEVSFEPRQVASTLSIGVDEDNKPFVNRMESGKPIMEGLTAVPGRATSTPYYTPEQDRNRAHLAKQLSRALGTNVTAARQREGIELGGPIIKTTGRADLSTFAGERQVAPLIGPKTYKQSLGEPLSNSSPTGANDRALLKVSKENAATWRQLKIAKLREGAPQPVDGYEVSVSDLENDTTPDTRDAVQKHGKELYDKYGPKVKDQSLSPSTQQKINWAQSKLREVAGTTHNGDVEAAMNDLKSNPDSIHDMFNEHFRVVPQKLAAYRKLVKAGEIAPVTIPKRIGLNAGTETPTRAFSKVTGNFELTSQMGAKERKILEEQAQAKPLEE